MFLPCQSLQNLPSRSVPASAVAFMLTREGEKKTQASGCHDDRFRCIAANRRAFRVSGPEHMCGRGRMTDREASYRKASLKNRKTKTKEQQPRKSVVISFISTTNDTSTRTTRSHSPSFVLCVELPPTSTFALSYFSLLSLLFGPSVSLSAVKCSNYTLSKNILLIYTYTIYFITLSLSLSLSHSSFIVNAMFPVEGYTCRNCITALSSLKSLRLFKDTILSLLHGTRVERLCPCYIWEKKAFLILWSFRSTISPPKGPCASHTHTHRQLTPGDSKPACVFLDGFQAV